MIVCFFCLSFFPVLLCFFATRPCHKHLFCTSELRRKCKHSSGRLFSKADRVDPVHAPKPRLRKKIQSTWNTVSSGVPVCLCLCAYCISSKVRLDPGCDPNLTAQVLLSRHSSTLPPPKKTEKQRSSKLKTIP
ncbi:unnamed protein product [Discosporangium mesarthrocarpum]